MERSHPCRNACLRRRRCEWGAGLIGIPYSNTPLASLLLHYPPHLRFSAKFAPKPTLVFLALASTMRL